MLRLTPYSWLTNEEFGKIYLSNNKELKNNKQNTIKKKKRNLLINNDNNKIKKTLQDFKRKKAKYNRKLGSKYTDIKFNISEKDLNKYLNIKKSYVINYNKNNHITYKVLNTDKTQPLVNEKDLQYVIKKIQLLLKIKETILSI